MREALMTVLGLFAPRWTPMRQVQRTGSAPPRPDAGRVLEQADAEMARTRAAAEEARGYMRLLDVDLEIVARRRTGVRR